MPLSRRFRHRRDDWTPPMKNAAPTTTDAGTYTQYPKLKGLPPLVRKQRRLEAQIVPIEPLIEDEKAVRKEIDALLVAAGLGKGESVTCLGYDVTHRERKGQSSFNADILTEQLLAEGLDRVVVLRILVESTETGEPSAWAEVKPSKGAKVRA